MSSTDKNLNCNFPEVTFSTFIISLASSALVGLGEVPDPGTGGVSRDFPLARHNIDILEMLRQKTLGRLEQQEARLLDNLLCDLRLKYVMLNDSSSKEPEKERNCQCEKSEQA